MSKVNLTETGRDKVGMDFILSNEENIEYHESYVVVKSTRTGKTFILKPEDIDDID